nr:1-phosphatidylinositol phosphodiesterase [Quercus suber]
MTSEKNLMAASTEAMLALEASMESARKRNNESYTFMHGLDGGNDEKAMKPLPARTRGRCESRNWMSTINNRKLMSALTIPGTHDSAAYTRAWPFVQTQVMSINSQLEAGIRFFDLRCGILDDLPVMVHGLLYLGLTLSDVLDVMYTFLEQNETEALIVQIKQDKNPDFKIHSSFRAGGRAVYSSEPFTDCRHYHHPAI